MMKHEPTTPDNNSSEVKPTFAPLQPATVAAHLQQKQQELADRARNLDHSPILEALKDQVAAYEHLRITPDTPIPMPIPVITIAGETISTEGNITTVSGASKSGKSAFNGWLLAGAISKDGILSDSLEGLRVEPNTEGRAVIHIDTEQAKHKHLFNLKATWTRAGMDAMPPYLYSYNIRSEDVSERPSLIEGICEAAAGECGGIHLIVIDGIADFISDVNDATESNAIVDFFEKLAMKYATPIVVIVHTNPGSDKERGHLGSQCQRKSESVLTVKQEGDISFLEPKFLRMAGKGQIPNLQFTYDKEKGYHVGCGVRAAAGNGAADAERVARIRSLCEGIFKAGVSLKSGEAVEAIMRATNKGRRTAETMWGEMKAHLMIAKGTDDRYRLSNPQNPQHSAIADDCE